MGNVASKRTGKVVPRSGLCHLYLDRWNAGCRYCRLHRDVRRKWCAFEFSLSSCFSRTNPVCHSSRLKAFSKVLA
ncbi:unnamed protein product [Taenia asiatica]|uniref:Uncharacterized protein n=1 Tax=Taenia asiatica TaxID=60517 RepID=A0A3P6NL97_TAEAS|nr:unnamed protein product [Taenia asiatica]